MLLSQEAHSPSRIAACGELQHLIARQPAQNLRMDVESVSPNGGELLLVENFNTSHCEATSKTFEDGDMDVEPVTWTGVLLSGAL